MKSARQKIEAIAELANRCLSKEYIAYTSPHKPWVTVAQRDNKERKLLVIYPRVNILSIHQVEAVVIANQIAHEYRMNISESLLIKERHKRNSITGYA